MGNDILEKASSLRSAVTWDKSFMDKIDLSSTKFFHPLPRHKDFPTIPFWVDDTSLNGYESQSHNGYLTRIVLLALFSGNIGSSFDGEVKVKPSFNDDFFQEVSLNNHPPREYADGIKNIKDGIVIDHILGEDYSSAWENIHRVMRIFNVYGRGGFWVDESHTFNSPKGMIKLPNIDFLGEKKLKRLAAVSPGCTVNYIRNYGVEKKIRLNMPRGIHNFDDLCCRNTNCISHLSHNEGAPAEFHRDENVFICAYCDTDHSYKQIWIDK